MKAILLLLLFLSSTFFVLAQNVQEQKPDLSKVKGLKPANIHFESTPVLQNYEVENMQIVSDPLDWKPSFSTIDPEADAEEHNTKLQQQRKLANEQSKKYYEELNQGGESFQKSKPVASSNSRQISTPSITKSFDANESNGTPFDNAIAIANNGTIISLTNFNVNIYNTNGVLQFTKALHSFVGYTTQYSACDPRIFYDDVYDQFVICVIKTPLNNYYSSELVIMTAKANNLGNWKRVKFSGSLKVLTRGVVPTSTWVDYPHMNCSKEDVFIGATLFETAGQHDGIVCASILQIKKSSLYNLATSSVSYKLWYKGLGIDEDQTQSIYPLKHGNSGSYGPGIYLISNYLNDDTFLFDITQDLADDPQLKVYAINNSLLNSVSASAGAPQKGTGSDTLLDNELTARVVGGFYYDKMVYYVYNAAKKNDPSKKSCIIYNTINLTAGLNNNLIATSKIISSSSGNFYTHANIEPSPNFLDDRSVICSFLSSGPYIYPSISALAIDKNNIASRIVTIKPGTGTFRNGFGFYEGNTKMIRWGDYSGICRRANDGSVWVSGMYSQKASPINKAVTHIAQIKLPVNLTNRTTNTNAASQFDEIVVEDSDMEYATNVDNVGDGKKQIQSTIAPNPVTDLFSIYFTLAEANNIKASIVDINGKTIKSNDIITLEKGNHVFNFDRSFLAKGMYYILLENEKQIISKEKIIIE